MKTNRAFTLVELSIVLLIVGILIAGVTQGSGLYRKSKLNGARSVTQSSPANAIYGIALWLDATAAKGFVSEPDDQDPVAQWNDTNPQQPNKSNATATGTQKPLYVTSGINGLPALKCDGVDDILSIPSGTNYFPTAAPSFTNSFTIFLVASATTTHEVDAQNNTNTLGTSGQKYVLGATHGGVYGGSSTIAGMGLSLGTNGATVYEHTGNYMPPIAVYSGTVGLSVPAVITIDYNSQTPSILINGTSVATGLTSTKTVFPSNTFCSGLYGAFAGFIGEVIVFDS